MYEYMHSHTKEKSDETICGYNTDNEFLSVREYKIFKIYMNTDFDSYESDSEFDLNDYDEFNEKMCDDCMEVHLNDQINTLYVKRNLITNKHSIYEEEHTCLGCDKVSYNCYSRYGYCPWSGCFTEECQFYSQEHEAIYTFDK